MRVLLTVFYGQKFRDFDNWLLYMWPLIEVLTVMFICCFLRWRCYRCSTWLDSSVSPKYVHLLQAFARPCASLWLRGWPCQVSHDLYVWTQVLASSGSRAWVPDRTRQIQVVWKIFTWRKSGPSTFEVCAFPVGSPSYNDQIVGKVTAEDWSLVEWACERQC